MDTKLATIVCSDVIGYSSLMQRDESGTLDRLNQCRALIDKLIDEHRGRLFNTGGDSVLIEFASAVDAVRFSVAMQTAMRTLNNGLRWRIGMHVGEVWIYGTNLMGDTVNLAARTESLADYGGVTMTEAVYALIKGKLKNHEYVSRGQQQFKNVDPMEIWSIVLDGAEPNPYLNLSSAKPDKTVMKSHSELIAAVVNDRSAKNRTVTDAQNFRRDGNLGPAVRILMWRLTRKDDAALNELLNLGSRELIPAELKPYVTAVLKEFCQKVNSDRAMQIADLLENSLNSASLAMQFIRSAAQVNEQAQYRYAMMIFSDPSSSATEIESVLSNLTESAMKKRVPAMLKLGEYYTSIGDKKNAFRWLYAARAQRSPEAQQLLEILTKTLQKSDFINYKTDADALVDQIKFIDDNRMR